MKRLLSYSGRILLTLVMIACACMLGKHLWEYYMEAPWTRDGRICADVVRLAPDVSGLIDKVLVNDNQKVHKGDILFRINTDRFKLALKQAKSRVDGTQAALVMAKRDLIRYKKLVETAAASRQQFELAETARQQASADHIQALAELDIAKLNVDRSTVRAPVNGIVNNLSLRPGDYATAGSFAMALIDTDSFYVAGYFQETKLERIHIGDTAIISPMGSSASLKGHVESISWGINDRERENSSILIDITPTFSWVRLAQRVPVRIQLDSIPESVRLIAGRTVNVEILRETSQRSGDSSFD